MKLLGRILIILAAAALIAGVTLAIVQLSGADQTTAQGFPGSDEGIPRGGGGDRLRDRDGTGTGPFSGQARPEGFERGRLNHQGFGDREGGLGVGLAGIARNLAIISLIVLVYWLGGKLFKILRPKARPAG